MGFLSFLQSPTSRCCSWVLQRMFDPWKAERAELFYWQRRYLEVSLLCHPLLQVLFPQGFFGWAAPGWIWDQELDICRCPWPGTRWTGRARVSSGECLGWTSSAFAGGCTNTGAASGTWSGEENPHFHGKKQVVSPGNKEMHCPYVCVSSVATVALKCDSNSCEILDYFLIPNNWWLCTGENQIYQVL